MIRGLQHTMLHKQQLGVVLNQLGWNKTFKEIKGSEFCSTTLKWLFSDVSSIV